MGSGVSGRRGVWRKGAMRGRAGGAAGEVAPVRWGRGTRRCRTVGNCPQKTTFPIPRPWVVGLPRYYPIIILGTKPSRPYKTHQKQVYFKGIRKHRHRKNTGLCAMAKSY
jgi:hypothetical protein